MDLVEVATFAAALPAGVAAAVLLFLRFLRRGAGAPTDAGIALAAGFAAGCGGVGGLPKFPHLEAWQWLVEIAALAAVVGAVERPAKPATSWGLRVALVLFAVFVTVLDRTALWIGGAGAAVLASLWCTDGLARRVGPSTFFATLLVVALGTAVALGVSGTVLIAQFSGASAAAAGACLVLSWFVPTSARGAVALAGVLPAALSLNGVIYSDLPIPTALLLAAAPAAAWGADRASASHSARRRAVLAIVAAAVFVGAAVAVAVIHAPPLDE